MVQTQQNFGGDWTVEKLERVKKYLEAYALTMKNQFYFRTFYVDAFAGTGYNTSKQKVELGEVDLLELAEQDTQKFLEGSARKALQVQPRFNKYVFIEKSPHYFEELKQLKKDYPALEADISLLNGDANHHIQQFCARMNNKDRAVLFLDPFGMQVSWQTIEAIANTKKIDLWYLFPLGMGVNRLLKKDGLIPENLRQKLDTVFGTVDWFDDFYHPHRQSTMFGEDEHIKVDDPVNAIKDYVLKRLKETFPPIGVAKNPLVLKNSKGSPLYLLCFAASNERGAKPAIKIAEHILK